MASNTVKCANCNVVINELLAFLHNVMDFMDEESIHQLCTTSFTVEDIVTAKALLFESLPNAKKMPRRRKEGKKKMSKDLDDIIGLMKSSDPEVFPIFVAKWLHKVPPVSFDHVNVTGLLRDILCLKNQLHVLEEKVVTVEKFELLKKEVEYMKHESIIDNFSTNVKVNKKRGACLQDSFVLDSGPIGLQYVPEYVPIKSPQSAVTSHNNSQSAVTSKVNERRVIVRHSSLNISNEDDSVSVACTQKKATDATASRHVEAPCAHTTVSTEANASGCRASKGCGDIGGVSGTECRLRRVEAPRTSTAVSTEPDAEATCVPSVVNVLPSNAHRSDSAPQREKCDARGGMLAPDISPFKQVSRNDNSEWQVVRSKSAKRYKLIGQRGCAATAPDGKFRAADVKVPLLISNVCKETSEADIIAYIKANTN